MVNDDGLSALQKDIFDKISKSDVSGLKILLSQVSGSVDFVDENGMTPLQHACYKGNVESVQMLLDQVGVDGFGFLVFRSSIVQFPMRFFLCIREQTQTPVNMA